MLSRIKIINLAFGIYIVLGLVFFGNIAVADTTFSCATGFTPQNGLCMPNSPFTGGVANQQNLMGLITFVVQQLLIFAGGIAILFLVVGGYWYITSAGNEETAEKGKKTLINALIGIVIILLSYGIITVVVNTLTKDTVI